MSSTLNPSSYDFEYLIRRVPEEYRQKQLRIINAYKKMQLDLTFSCTPYYVERVKPGWHVAWAESSAVMYANSVLGFWTNREGSPSALAAALIGKTPDYGMHRAENRQPNILVKVEAHPQNEAEFGALGIYVGKIMKDKIPIFRGLSNYTNEDLKQLGAGMATSGMTSMFHYQEPHKRRRELERVSVEAMDIKNTMEELSTSLEAPDLIFIGCPHCSLNEIRHVARVLEGKRVKKEAELWVCTSRHIKGKAKSEVEIIERAGGHVLCDTCAVVTWIKNFQIDTMMTNSAKTAYYAPTFNGVNVALAPLNQCVNAACQNGNQASGSFSDL